MADTPPDSSPAPQPAPSRTAQLALLLSGVAVAAGLGFAWIAYDRMGQLETQLARRIGEFDAASKEARAAAQAANAALGDLQNRLLALESRAQETQDQQLALTAMYQDLARSQDERVVADIEQTLLLAQQQLQLAGNVRAALIGLEAAETRLVQLDKPQFAALRAAMGKDIARLKLMPAADTEGLNARLEALVQGVDQLKPESESEPAAPARSAVQAGPADTLVRLGREIWTEFKGLVRIRRLDHPDLPLLTPTQSYFLGQNLKLRLLAARQALIQRDEASFRADLGAARTWVARYYNRQEPASQAFVASLDELLKAPVAIQDAQIAASLQAARAARKSR
ncbi:MAG: uroporphyrinogen-III C-methyltransferase [Pseudomonadota bacterium]